VPEVADDDKDIVATAAALTRTAPPMVQPLNGTGLSFNLTLGSGAMSLPSSTTTAAEQQRMMEVAASL
jgi:hypothetical protein